MQYLIVLLLAVSASATYDYGHSYYPSTYGQNYGNYYGYGNLGYNGLGYGVGGYSYAPTSYYGGGAAISKYISPAVTSYAAPAVTSYAAPAVTSYAAPAAAISYAAPAVAAAPAVSYVKPAVTYAAAPAVSYVKPAVTYAAAPAVSYVKPAVSYVKPAVSYAAAPAVSYVSRPAATYVAAPQIQNPLVKGHISFTMGSASKGHSGISSGKLGSAFNLHRNKAHPFPGSNEGKSAEFPNFPKPVTDVASGSSGFNSEVSDPSNVRPGVEYTDGKPVDSSRLNEKPLDSSFFDATKSSENDNSGYDLLNPDSKREDSAFDSDSFFDENKSSEADRSGFEITKSDSKDKSSFDSESFFDETKSSETDRSGFEITKPDSKDRISFDSDKYAKSNGAGFENVKSSYSHDKSDGSSSRFDTGKVDVENHRRESSSRPGVKQPFLGGQKSSYSNDRQFLAGIPKIKFVMGRQARGGLSANRPFQTVPYPKRVFRDGPTSFHSTLRDRIFYLSEGGVGPAYDYSTVYGPSASLLYDGGEAAFFLDGAGPEEEVFTFKKK